MTYPIHASTYRRDYTAAELKALRKVLKEPIDPAVRGPAQFACGPYWPEELRRRAREAERLIPLLRLAADALEREIARDPRCASPAGVQRPGSETHDI